MKIHPLLTPDASPSAVILANGDYPVHPLPLALLEKSNFIVCCDGAMNTFGAKGKFPAAIVGDGDSLAEEYKVRFASIVCHNPDQETNDQTKAVQYCLQQGKKELLILGATGKREDHSLGNISLLADYINEASVTMATDYGTFTAVKGNSCFKTYPGEQVSVFSLDPVAITVSNLLYSIDNRVLTSWWQGTLNQALGNEFTLFTTGRAIVFREY